VRVVCSLACARRATAAKEENCHALGRIATKRQDRSPGVGAGRYSNGRAGGLGIGTIIILGLVGWAVGINPLLLIGGAEILSSTGGTQQGEPAPSDAEVGSPDQSREFVTRRPGKHGGSVEGDLCASRQELCRADPGHVLWVTRSACGVAQSAMGPFTPPSSEILSGAFVAAGARALNSRRLT
jgi:uncharacterized protein